jgi:hypothetical protein
VGRAPFLLSRIDHAAQTPRQAYDWAVNEWLETARKRLAEAVGADPSAYDLSPADVERILELARVAAHESGDRTNAPLLSYLVGVAHGRNPDRALDELVEQTTSA